MSIKNTSVFATVALILSVAFPAFAQSYTYSSYGTSSSACPSISRDLVRGSHGADVTSLQQFLVSRNYPGGGSWMITGNFGAATQAAVRNFQTEQNIPVSGWVDATTRLAIDHACAGGSYSPTYPTYAPSYTPPFTSAPTYPTFAPISVPQILPQVLPYQNYGSIVPQLTPTGGCIGYNAGYYNTCSNTASSISYIYPTSGAVGASVTIFGNGFSTSGNTVHFGNGIITNLGSNDGRSVSFVVPSQLTGFGTQLVQLGSYNVSVTNSSGVTTGALPFVVNSLSTYGTPNIVNVTGPNQLAQTTQGTWTLTLGNYNTNGMLYGYFTASVLWGDENLNNTTYQQNLGQTIYGSNGNQIVSFNHTYSQPGNYSIIFKVTNTSGVSTQTLKTVTVIANGTQTGGTLTLSSISPIQGSVGTQLMLTGSGFSSLDNMVHFGSGGTAHVVSQNGSTIYYTIPYSVSPCDIVGSGCTSPSSLVVPGTYPVYVTNAQGTSNTTFVTVQ